MALPTSSIKSWTATLRAKVQMKREKNQAIIPEKIIFTLNNFSHLT